MDPDQQADKKPPVMIDGLPVSDTLAQFQAVADQQDAAAKQASDQVNEDLAARQLATRNVSTPAQLAEILNAPGNRDAMLAAAHKKFGNQFVEEAVRLADARVAADQSASAALTTKYGLRPRRYAGMVDGTNAAELVFRQVVPLAVEFINQQAASRKLRFRLTVAELMTNFIAEGGNRVLDDGMLEGIDGFGALGIDTFMDRYDELKPWLHPSVTKERVTPVERTNEKNQKVTSITDLTLVQAVHASAAMLAHAQAALESDMRSRPGGFDGLTDRQETYFTTTYYNAGPGYGKNLLAKQGAAAANRRWTGTDDHGAHSRKPHFNATMRTSSWENVQNNVLAGGQFRSVQAHGVEAEAAREGVDFNQSQLAARLARAEESIAGETAARDSMQSQLAGADPEDHEQIKRNIAIHDDNIRTFSRDRDNLRELLDSLAAAETQLPAAPAEPTTP